VILDPLLTYVNAKLDTHKDAEVRKALEPVVKIAHHTKVSVIGLIHVNKSNEGDLMNRVMGSRAIGAVARGVRFCATYKPVEDMVLDDDDPFMAADPTTKRARFVFGQIKNNLEAKAMVAHEYHMQGMVVGYDQEAQKDIRGSHLLLDGVIQENVEDIVLEQEKRIKATKTKGSDAQVWLVTYLVGKGEVLSKRVEDAEAAGFKHNAIQRAREGLGNRIVVRRLPIMHSSTTWALNTETSNK
jgi:hypothetical protein